MTPSRTMRWRTVGFSPVSPSPPGAACEWTTSEGGAAMSFGGQERSDRGFDRVAVVTGGASGMGEATCYELGRRGHAVAVLDLDESAAQRVADTLRAQGVTALAVGVDVSDHGAVGEAFAKVKSELGPVHILVTSAGIVGWAPSVELTPQA